MNQSGSMPKLAQLDDILQQMSSKHAESMERDYVRDPMQVKPRLAGSTGEALGLSILEKQGFLYRNLNWLDSSTKTRCELKLEVTEAKPKEY